MNGNSIHAKKRDTFALETSAKLRIPGKKFHQFKLIRSRAVFERYIHKYSLVVTLSVNFIGFVLLHLSLNTQTFDVMYVFVRMREPGKSIQLLFYFVKTLGAVKNGQCVTT